MSPRSSFDCLLLDFDGTLVDSAEGILLCLRHTMATVLGRPLPEQGLLSMIGQPLRRSFAPLCDHDPQILDACVEAYRNCWYDQGQHLWRLFPQVRATLDLLRQRGHRLVVASAKSHQGLAAAVTRCGLGDLIDDAFGAHDGEADKTPLVSRALAAQSGRAVMVGDHHVDGLAAAAAGIPFIAATYGYDDPAALAALRPWRSIAAFSDLPGCLGACKE